MTYTPPDLERITWHKVGVIYPRIDQKIMLLFRDGSIVITLYNGFRGWCPRPLRWARHPTGPKDLVFEEEMDLSTSLVEDLASARNIAAL